MKRLLLAFTLALGVGAVLCQQVIAEMPVPPAPRDGYVLDQTGTLSKDETAKLNEKITDYRKRTSVQLAVLMVPRIAQDDYLEHFSINVARTWGIGEKDKNNGALLLIAKDDRKLRIEVGTGLEGDLTDARSSRIIRDRIAPQFREGKYYQGIYSGLEGIALAIGKTDDPVLATEESNGWLGNIGEIITAVGFIGAAAISWFGAILGRTKSWWAGGVVGGVLGGLGTFFVSSGNLTLTAIIAIVLSLFGLLFDFLVSKNYRTAKDSGHTPSWWAGGGSLGGGGGSSFGGGSFGGGGSSGSW